MDNQITLMYLEREADLSLCLEFDSWLSRSSFTVGERIMINQERGALFEAVSNESDSPRYRLEGELADKVEAALKYLRTINFNAQFKLNNYNQIIDIYGNIK